MHLIPVTLPSFYAVNPDEVILCLDKPAPRRVLEVTERVVKAYKAEDITRIIEVERNPEYAFHQAWVRRKGFLEAKYDSILTTDIDLFINKNVLTAVEIAGKNNVGLVSCSKIRYPKKIVGFFRYVGETFLRKIIHRLVKFYRGKGLEATSFTGLYAIWRPYWLKSEDNGIKKLVNPKQVLRGEKISFDVTEVYPIGEDTYLRDCMATQYCVIYSSDIGAICLTDLLEDHPHVQFWIGFYFASRGRSLLGALVRTILRLQVHYFSGHLYGKKFLKRRLKSRQYSLEDARKYWEYAPLSITVGGSKLSTRDLIRQPDDALKRIVERSIYERNLKEGASVYREKIKKWIKKEHLRYMLDFGCGIGQDGVYFAKNCGVTVDFADIVESNVILTKCYNRIWNISANSIFINTDPKKFSFPRQYDMILANGVLHHTPSPKEIVQNLSRFLKPKGLFICMLYTPKHFKATKAKSLEQYAKLSEGLAPVENPYSDFYDEEKVKKLFEGFHLLETFTTHKGKFGWYVFRKVA